MEDGNAEIQCPYNPSHWVRKSRMPYHIVKCKKNYPLAEKMVCPFNFTHHVDKPMYQHHVSTCPERRVIEGYKYELANVVHGDIDCTPNQQAELPLPEENWNTDTPVTTYNPNERLESVPVIRKLQGGTKSQRKAFRLTERQRMQRLMEGDPRSSSSNDSPDYQAVEGNDLVPLQLPRMQSEDLRLLNPSLGLGRGRHRASEQEHNPGSAPNLELAQAMSDTGYLHIPITVGRGKPIMKYNADQSRN